jgi:hypothetical protein
MLFGRLFSRWPGAVLAVIAVGVYTVFVAGEPAVFCAAILGGLAGQNLLRTDRNGWMELTTDGEQLWVQVERR